MSFLNIERTRLVTTKRLRIATSQPTGKQICNATEFRRAFAHSRLIRLPSVESYQSELARESCGRERLMPLTIIVVRHVRPSIWLAPTALQGETLRAGFLVSIAVAVPVTIAIAVRDIGTVIRLADPVLRCVALGTSTSRLGHVAPADE